MSVYTTAITYITFFLFLYRMACELTKDCEDKLA